MRKSLLIVACMAALLTLAESATAQSNNGQSIPEAPQPQKKPAKPADKPPAESTPPADNTTPTQDPGKDENAFPEAVSRNAAKAAADTSAPDAPAGSKHPTADDNPFPEAVSRDAAKAAADEQTPPPTAKTDLPPGVSSSQSSSVLGDSSEGEGSVLHVDNPDLAKKDAEVGGFYLKTGNYQGALLRYKDATVADPTNVGAIFGLAEAQRMLGKNQEAARSYQTYLAILPNGPKAKEATKALKALQSAK